MVIRALTAHLSSQLIRQFTVTMNNKKPEIVFVLGPPGSGKGTQCTRISQKFDFIHFSTGDLLRKEYNTPGSEFGQQIARNIRESIMVPVEITLKVLEKAFVESGGTRFIVDAFPGNQDNVDGWNKEMVHRYETPFVLYFECSLETCQERVLKRGADGSGRLDDNLNNLNRRFATFVQDALPVIKMFEEKGLLRTVNSERDPDTVFQYVCDIFQKCNFPLKS